MLKETDKEIKEKALRELRDFKIWKVNHANPLNDINKGVDKNIKGVFANILLTLTNKLLKLGLSIQARKRQYTQIEEVSKKVMKEKVIRESLCNELLTICKNKDIDDSDVIEIVADTFIDKDRVKLPSPNLMPVFLAVVSHMILQIGVSDFCLIDEDF